MCEWDKIKRSKRRAHRNRMINRVRYIEKYIWSSRIINMTEEEKELESKLLADNLKKCSCYACGNPRKYFKQRTRQEIIAKMSEEDDG